MQPLNLLTTSISLLTISLTGLVSFTQPSNIQADASIPKTSTAPNSDTRTAQTLSIDDAAERVEDEIENHPTLKPFDLDADNEGNAIVLKGTVRDASQRTLAEEIAKRTAPGFTIINRINIE